MRPAAEIFAPFFIDAAGAKPDVRLRVARFDADDPRALCVLLNGQTEFIEKYFDVIDDLRRRGFAVVTMDWRGQGGSDRLLADPRKGHILDFSQYDEDLDALMREVVAPVTARLPRAAKPLAGEMPIAAPATRRVRLADTPTERQAPQGAQAGPEGEIKIIALAHSMGGHILLRRLRARTGEFAAAILCAPMIAIHSRGVPWWLTLQVTRRMLAHGEAQQFVWGFADRDPSTLPFDRQIVTSDPARYRRTQEILTAHPGLRINGPTWGWLGAAIRSITAITAPGQAETIHTPLLVFTAGEDKVCISQAAAALAARMPQAVSIAIAGAQHEILMERTVFRDRLWEGFDSFIDRLVPRA
jgi:lysophospholipase